MARKARLLRRRDVGADALQCAHRRVTGGFERRVERVRDQVGAGEIDADDGALQRHRNAVGRAQAMQAADFGAGERPSHSASAGSAGATSRLSQVAPGRWPRPIMSCEKLVNTRERFLETVGDAGAGAMALDEEPIRNEALDRLAHGDPRQPEADGKVAFARDGGAGREHLPLDRRAQRFLDAPVERGRAGRVEPRVPLQETDQRLDFLDRFDDRGPVAHRKECPSL